MSRHRWLGACLLGVSLVVVARADNPPRHVPLPPGPTSNDPDSAFTEHLSRIKNWNEKWADKAKGLSEADINRITEFVQKNRDKATDPKAVSGLISQILGKDLSATDKTLIESMLKNLSPDTLKGMENPTTKTPDNPTPSTTPNPDTKAPDTPKPDTPTTSPGPNASSSPSEEEQAEQEALARDLAQFAKQFEGLVEAMPESPAMQKLFQDLAQFRTGLDNNPTGPAPGDNLSLARMARSIRDLNGWLKVDGNSFNQITPPRMGMGPLPSIPNGQFARFLPSISPMGPPGFGSLPGPRSVAIFAGVVAVILLVAWKFRDYLPGLVAAGTGTGWQLGDWPVEPGKVSTRAELVRAFDYLSLRRFGQAALSWNHRTVAARIGAGDAELTRAAERLASTYERARYAPETGPLDEAALAEARSDLCYLAGTVGV